MVGVAGKYLNGARGLVLGSEWPGGECCNGLRLVGEILSRLGAAQYCDGPDPISNAGRRKRLPEWGGGQLRCPAQVLPEASQHGRHIRHTTISGSVLQERRVTRPYLLGGLVGGRAKKVLLPNYSRSQSSRYSNLTTSQADALRRKHAPAFLAHPPQVEKSWEETNRRRQAGLRVVGHPGRVMLLLRKRVSSKTRRGPIIGPLHSAHTASPTRCGCYRRRSQKKSNTPRLAERFVWPENNGGKTPKRPVLRCLGEERWDASASDKFRDATVAAGVDTLVPAISNRSSVSMSVRLIPLGCIRRMLGSAERRGAVDTRKGPAFSAAEASPNLASFPVSLPLLTGPGRRSTRPNLLSCYLVRPSRHPTVGSFAQAAARNCLAELPRQSSPSHSRRPELPHAELSAHPRNSLSARPIPTPRRRTASARSRPLAV